MNRFRHITLLLTALLTVLSAVTCRRQSLEETEIPELQVSLYIPGSVMTKADTEPESNPETKVTSLRVWAFLSSSGEKVSYKEFTSNEKTDLMETALPNNTVTRFGLPLTEEMFQRLTSTDPRPKVDVYAIANAESACSILPGKGTSRAELDLLTLNKGFGGSRLTTEVPEDGLPMSGVLLGADVTGGYPVLNITTLTLTRAVSKIRFVFCQQKDPDTGYAANDKCAIVSIEFDETAQIAKKEKLFTNQKFDDKHLFDIGTDSDRYCALDASLTGQNGTPLIPNDNLSLVDDPEDLAFRSPGHDTETVERYEARLDKAVGPLSQAGPIYLCETDKLISGTITYRINDNENKTVSFSMQDGTIFARNYSWIVYACFAEETMSLKLKVVVAPWDWEEHYMDFSNNSVNVIRRFTVFDTNPKTFDKVQTKDGFYNIAFWHDPDRDPNTDPGNNNIIHGDIIIASPVTGILHIIPVPGVIDGFDSTADAIKVNPDHAFIYYNPNEENIEDGTIEGCRIPITIQCNPALIVEDPDHPERPLGYKLIGNYIDLHFTVELPGGLGFVDLDSESIDLFRFVIWDDWENWHVWLEEHEGEEEGD